jgi:myo-inositol 2-dehydrogenase / D-chiro-inositol 1-dehydrogenase
MIGCGGISFSSHGPSYVKYRASHPDFVLAACCDLNKELAEKYQAQFGFARAYTDFRLMIETEKPDAVCVIVSEAAACQVAEAVMSYGVPMMMEKPPGKNSGETRRLLAAALRGHVPHQVAFNRRFIPLAQVGRSWLAGKEDTIQYIRYDFFRFGRNDADFSDTAVHAIDAVRYLTGANYEEIHFTYQDFPGRRAGNVYMNARMTSQAAAHIHVCPASGIVLERATIHFADKTIFLHLPIWANGFDIPGQLTLFSQGKVVEEVSGKDVCDSSEVYLTNGFYRENEVFFDSIQQHKPLESNFESALETMLVKECYGEKREYWHR